MEPDLEYLRGLRVFRDDPQWTSKALVAGVLMLSTMIIPILGSVVLLGWTAVEMRRAVRGAPSLPELEFNLDYLGKLAGIGFKGFIVSFVWMLPVLIIFGATFGCFYVSMITTALESARSGHVGGPPPAMPIGMVAMMLVVWPLMIIATMFSRVAAMRAELTDDLSAGLSFKEVTSFVKMMFGDLFKGMLIHWLVSIPLIFLGELACCVGVFVSATAIQIMQADFMAQVYLRYVARGGAPLTIAGEPPGAGGPQPAPVAF